MSTNLLAIAAQLSDEALLAKVKLLTERSRAVTVELIAHLGELGVRKIHCAEGPGSLFRYCTEILRLSEAAACNRIRAARAARKFPVILDLLADGAVNMTTIRLLAAHLTVGNHEALLAEATGMTRRQVDKLVARLAPQPDVPSSIRKLPAPMPAPSVQANAPSLWTPPEPERKEGATSASKPSVLTAAAVSREAPASPPAPKRPVVAPLSPERYRLQFTIGKKTEEDLRRLQDLLRREIPDGDPGEIVARALQVFLREVEKRTFSATSRPRPARGTKRGSRHVPAEVERTVWERDGGQCAFVAGNGHRCTERSYLEFHHATKAYAQGGEATVENISLRCRAHNVYEARLIFGRYDPSPVRETPQRYWSRDQ